MARLPDYAAGQEFGNTNWISSITGTVTADSSIKRSGNYSYKATASGSWVKTFTASTELYFRWGVYIAQSAAADFSMIQIKSDNDVICTLYYINGTGLIQVYRGQQSGGTLLDTTDIVMSLDTWYRLELHFKMSDTVGVATVRIDGVEAATFTGDTNPGAFTTFNSYKVSCTNTTTIYIDDQAINNTTGSTDNAWCGSGKYIALTGNGDGAVNQWVGQDGDSTSNYLNIDDIPPDDDTTYNQSSTSGHQDAYAMTAYTPTGTTISRVCVMTQARDTVGGGSIKLLVRTGGTIYKSDAIPLTASYTTYAGTDYPTNPQSGVEWVVADLDAIQVGQEVV